MQGQGKMAPEGSQRRTEPQVGKEKEWRRADKENQDAIPVEHSVQPVNPYMCSYPALLEDSNQILTQPTDNLLFCFHLCSEIC